MSFVQFFRILWARRWITVLTTLTCFLGAMLVASLLPARYQGKSRLILDIVKPDPVTGEMVNAGFAKTYVQTQTELIKDYRITGKVVDDLGWTSSPDMAAAYARRSPDDKRDFRRWLAQRISDNTEAQLIDFSNIMEIQYTSDNPETAARVADAVRAAYVNETLALRRDEAVENEAWFRKQADRVRADLNTAEKKKSDFEKANGIILQDNNVDADTAKLNALAAAQPAINLGSMVTNPGISPAQAQLEQINASISNTEKVLGPNNPDLIALKKQRDALAQVARASTPSVSRGPAGPSIAALYSEQQRKVLAQRGKVAEAQQLAADVTVLRDQYAKTVQKAADEQQKSESTITGLTLLGNATEPTSPIFPKWPLVIAGSLGLGFLFGLLLSMLVELLARRVRGPEDLNLAGVPVVGIMASNAPPTRRRLFRWKRHEPATTAAYGA
ncbi:Wzz/FepE/Etk N-terminal domain-containing protein [Sphingomonas sp.]|uniref:GumC family protein n=1 Tax=Sphingomonas sp. TaxID=28214 RepID=UPI00258034A2|nr:Wzz/FepE/Etk N-terminal domain-containing protein [Sphingomonas sp.]